MIKKELLAILNLVPDDYEILLDHEANSYFELENFKPPGYIVIEKDNKKLILKIEQKGRRYEV